MQGNYSVLGSVFAEEKSLPNLRDPFFSVLVGCRI